MNRSLLLPLACFSFLASPTLAADAPRVATDIRPVQSLAARVMEGAGTPSVLLPPGADAHGFTLRPSDARLLSEAEIVFWIGPSLTPWLERAIDSLAQNALHVELADTPGLRLLDVREGAGFETHTHAEDDAHDQASDDIHDDHGHDDHAHDEHAQDDHGHESQAADSHEHAHDGIDPHLWLDPRNAAAIMRRMGAVLAEADPERAALYITNAEAGAAEMAALEDELRDRLAPLAGAGFLVAHDSYHYFEARFGIEAVGAIAASDASRPGAARIGETEALLEAGKVSCVFAEPETSDRLPRALAERGGARLAVLDHLGAGQEPGAGLYPAILRSIAQTMEECLSAD